MQTTRGAARVLLLLGLVVAGVALTVSVWLLVAGGVLPGSGGDPLGDDVASGDGPVDDGVPLAVPDDPLARRDRDDRDRRPGRRGGGDPDGEDPDAGILTFGDGLREPSGETYEVTVATLEEAIDLWMREPGTSEHVRRMIEVLQEKGVHIPEELVARVLDRIEDEDEAVRRDVELTLGMLEEPVYGRRLAELAADPGTAPGVRRSVLRALAQSGNPAALPGLQALLEQGGEEGGLDDDLLRHLAPALGAIGGPDATRTLLGLLEEHVDDGLRGSFATALGQTEGSGEILAERLRTALQEGERGLVGSLVSLGIMQGLEADPGLRTEILQLVENPSLLQDLGDELEVQKLRGSAMIAAARMGEVEAVLRVVETSQGPLRDAALYALRSAQGDDAARVIASEVRLTGDAGDRRELTVALGQTGSRAATETLVDLLDDREPNVRQAAASGLATVGDPGATEAILEHLSREGVEKDVARELIKATGVTGDRRALERLNALRDREGAPWDELRPWIRQAIKRIEDGHPQSLRMD